MTLREISVLRVLQWSQRASLAEGGRKVKRQIPHPDHVFGFEPAAEAAYNPGSQGGNLCRPMNVIHLDERSVSSRHDA